MYNDYYFENIDKDDGDIICDNCGKNMKFDNIVIRNNKIIYNCDCGSINIIDDVKVGDIF